MKKLSIPFFSLLFFTFFISAVTFAQAEAKQHIVIKTPRGYKIEDKQGNKTEVREVIIRPGISANKPSAPCAKSALSFGAMNTAAAASGSCPADITVNNDAGKCGAAVNYPTPTCIPKTYTQSSSNDIELGGLTGSCANRYFRPYNLPALGITQGFTISSVDFGVAGNLGGNPVTVNIYKWNPSTALSYANFTLLNSAVSNIGDAGFGVVNQPISAFIPAGSALIVEIVGNGTDMRSFYIGGNQDSQTAPSYYSLTCDANQSIIQDFYSYVINPIGCDAGATITQTQGLSSGSMFPVGTTTNTFQASNGPTCSFNVTVVNTYQITTQPQNTSACKGTTATFTVAASGTNLNYKWHKGNSDISNNSPTLTIANVQPSDAGNYTVDVIESCGTLTSNAATLTVNSASTPVVTVANNCGNSTLSTTATGSLLWSTGETASSITVTDAGIYKVTQNVNGCTSDPGSGTAAPKASPSAPVVTVANNCGSSSLSTTASGSLQWSTHETSSSINVSNAGTYTVTQTVNGCTSDAGSADAAPKSVPSAPSVSVSNNCGSSTLSTTASGNLLWSTNETSFSINVSNAGTYTVTQTVNGCTSDKGSGTAAPKTSPSKPVVTANGSTDFCQGGSVILSAPSGFTSYKWSNNATTQTITVTQSGSYSVMVTNSGGCSSPASDATTVTVGNDTQKPDITCPAAVSLCYDASENYTIASLQATDNCGIASISYTISGATTRSGSGINASGKFSSGTSTITWTVKDGSGNTSTCQSNVTVNEKFTVAIPDGWALGSGCTLNTVYIGYSPASYILLVAKPTGGKSPYTYKWSNGATASFILVNPAAATTYTVTVKDAKGCTQTATKQINVVDVRCGSKMDKVTLCYKGSTMCTDQKDVAGYLLKGAYLGNCNVKSTASKSANVIIQKEAQEENELTVKVSPNPSTAFFKLTISSSNVKDKVTISIVDEVGRAVETKTASAGQSIQIGDRYRAGMYFAQAIQGNKRVTIKLVKQAW